MKTHIPLGRNRVQFREVQPWTAQGNHYVKPGVYIDGNWVGNILSGSAFYPEQITVGAYTSPKLQRKNGVKGNIKRIIRYHLMNWAINAYEENKS